MRRKKTLPVARADDVLQISIDDTQWRRIQKSYGHDIPPGTRQEVIDATQTYLMWATFELGATPQKDAEAILTNVTKRAHSLWSALHKNLSGGGQAAIHVRYFIRKHLQDNRISEDADKIHFVTGIMTSFVSACDRAMNELLESEASGFRKGQAWDNWIVSLRTIVKRAGLPFGVRKDTRVSDLPSPFVALVRELQRLLPKNYRRAKHSDDALAQAIQRGRRVTKGRNTSD